MNKATLTALRSILLIVLIVGTVLIIRKKGQRDAYVTFNGTIFGTTYMLTYQGDERLRDSCVLALESVDAALSMFNPQSNLSQINRGETPIMTEMTREVISLAMAVSEETDGAFDITVGPLVNAWGFGFKNGELPDSAKVNELLEHVGWNKVTINGDSISFDNNDTIHIPAPSPACDKKQARSDMILDCSAIAKGYGCDMVAKVLCANGVRNCMIEIGGEIVTFGVNPKGKPWQVGVSKPSETEQGVMSVIPLTNAAMATSGNYRNFFVSENGKKISHTIDPKTGWPVRHSLLSATVIGPQCAVCDAFATAFMVMGLDRAMEVVKTHDELDAYFIYEDEDGTLKTWASWKF